MVHGLGNAAAAKPLRLAQVGTRILANRSEEPRVRRPPRPPDSCDTTVCATMRKPANSSRTPPHPKRATSTSAPPSSPTSYPLHCTRYAPPPMPPHVPVPSSTSAAWARCDQRGCRCPAPRSRCCPTCTAPAGWSAARRGWRCKPPVAKRGSITAVDLALAMPMLSQSSGWTHTCEQFST